MISIRKVRAEEVGLLRELNKRVFVKNPEYDEDLVVGFADTEMWDEYFKEFLNKPGEFCFFAIEDEKPIGYVSGVEMKVPYRRSRYFELENLGVVPEKKGKGVGKMLLDWTCNWAKDNGFEKIYLNCYIKNKEAIEFYKRNGFGEIDISFEKKI